MNPKYEWLNEQIDRMQADERLNPRPEDGRYEPNVEDLRMLQVAVLFNSRRPGKGTPRPEFVELSLVASYHRR